MKRLMYAAIISALFCTLGACAGKADAATQLAAESSVALGAGGSLSGGETGSEAQMVQTFEDAKRVRITGYLQHIEVTAAAGDTMVIRWTGDEAETVVGDDGNLVFSFPEPDWLDKSLPNDGTQRYSVVSTIYVELPESIDTAEFYSTLGDITIGGATDYRQLTAETVDGNVTVRGLAGNVLAYTGRGSIAPDTWAAEIVEAEYGAGIKSKRLETTIAGAVNPQQRARLYSESGKISINEPEMQ